LKVIGLGKDPKANGFEYTFDNNAGGAIYTDASSLNISQCGVRSVIEDNQSIDDNVNLVLTSDIIYCVNNKKQEQLFVTNNYFWVWDNANIVSIEKSNGRYNSITENTFDFNVDKKETKISSTPSMILLNDANTEYALNPSLSNLPNNSYIALNVINSLNHSKGLIGIQLKGQMISTSEKLAINNVVVGNKFNDFCGLTGIFLDGVSKTRVSRNTAIGYLKSASGMTSGIGIHVKGTLGMPSANNVICTNSMDFTNYNYKFEGVCPENQFSGNYIYRSSIAGLHLSPMPPPLGATVYEAVIGQQWKTDSKDNIIAYKNIWASNTKTNPALKPKHDALFQEGKAGSADVTLSQFKIDNQKTKYPDAPEIITVPSNVKPNKWFEPIANFKLTYPSGCEGVPITAAVDSPPNSIVEDTWNSLDESILEGEYGSNYAVTNWEAKYFLYKRMLAFPEILENNENRIGFFKTVQGTNIEKYIQIKNAIDRSFDIEFQNAEDLDVLLEKQNLIASSMHEYISTIGAEYSEEEGFPDFAQSVIATKSKEIIEVTTKIKAIQAEIDEKRMTVLENLYAGSESLTATASYEIDYKTVYSLWLKAAIQNGRLNDEDLVKIRKIAQECISESGTAVLYARDLLPSCERTRYPDDYNCNGIINTPVTSKIAKNNNSSVVYPTPVDNMLYLSLYEFKNASKISITDVNGRIVLNNNIERANNQIVVSTLENGLYLVHIQDKEGNSLKVEKIIVQH
jgi:hypothetical protein